MSRDWRTTLIHPGVAAQEGFRSLATPTYRGSTTLFDSAAAVRDHWDQRHTRYSYGLYGTPTSMELAARVAELEGGQHCFLTPGGQAAITLIYLAFVRSGGHVLLPDSIYGPNRDLADRLLARLGVAADYYDPSIGAGIARLIRENTQLVWCESPGSVTMEVQDVPAIVKAARKSAVPVALDNTYAAGVLFDAFSHGVDVSMQALTKYVGGHSDVLLGSVTVPDLRYYEALGDTHQLLGMNVSPDDCSLALRGLQTLGVRLAQLEASTLSVAQWLSRQPEVATVLHPALPSCPGHEVWRRDFAGSSSVFSIVFDATVSREAIVAFVDALQLFKIGYSWGGVTSLAMPFFALTRQHRRYERVLRLNVGLEAAADLIADLEGGFSVLRG